MNTLTRKLIAKELYVNRWMVAGGAISGVLSVLIATLGKTGFNVGGLTWLTTIIAVGVMLALYGIMYERKEHALLFVMSLPLSIAGYVRAKVVGLALCFLVVWLTSSAAALLLVFAKAGIPDGLAPYMILLCVFMLANFAVVLCGTLQARSEAATSAIIVITNMGVSIFMFTVGPQPGIAEHMWAPHPVWNSTFWTVLACELAVLAIAFALPFFLAARRRDFI
ncbi:MAG TPA: ABC-2 transporter permease [Steroidobacteraceae bacterium]|nr:ABC-2 transporter permease [Steroidobacteraceae bacterium]